MNTVGSYFCKLSCIILKMMDNLLLSEMCRDSHVHVYCNYIQKTWVIFIVWRFSTLLFIFFIVKNVNSQFP